MSEFLTPQSRNEAILQNICGENNVLPEPQSRIEKLLQAILYEDETIVDFEPESRAELLLYAILTHGEYDAEPQSRNEAILKAILTNGEYDALPQSRIEALLIEWLDHMHYTEKTVSGDVVSINDAVDAPVADLTAAIVPVQSGSGDPSPTNIRPISGWTECKVTRAGKNLFLFSDSDMTASLYGMTATFDRDTETFTVSGTETRGSAFTLLQNNSDYHIPKFTAGETYYLNILPMSGGVNNSVYFQISYKTKSNTNATLVTGYNSKQFTVPANFDYVYNIFVGIYAGATDVDYSFKVQIVSGSAATAYEPYRGDTYTVAFGSSGTVYGGTLDVTTGTLTVTRVMLTKNTSTMDNSENFPGWNNSGVKQIIGAGVNDRIIGAFSNISPMYASGGSGGIHANTLGSNDLVYLTKTHFGKSQSEWIALAIDVQMIIPLATPIVYNLSPVEIRTLVGQNTVWADTGNVTVTYKAQRTAAALMMMAGRF